MKLRILAIFVFLAAVAADRPSCGPSQGTVSGTSFRDANGNGVQDGLEIGVVGRTIFLDQDYDGVLDPGELTATTAAAGAYTLDVVPTGTWAVGEVVPSGYEQTEPAGLSLTAPVEYTGGRGPRSPAVADLDLDGDLDVAVADNKALTTSVYLNNGDGTFAAPTLYEVGDTPRRVLAIRLNADAYPDLAVSNFVPNNVSILINNGDGTFAPQVTYPVGDGVFSMEAADWDFDGDLDLVTVDLGSNTMTRLRNDGNGVFSSLDQSPTGLRPHSIDTTDFNHDGFLDFVVTNLAETFVTIYFGTAGGGIAPGVQVQVGGDGPIESYALDLNHDGDLDLVTANLCFFCEQYEDVSILFGHGDGTFDAPTIVSAGFEDSAHEIDFVDLNDDGELDMAVPGSSTGELAVFLNQGSGVFGPVSLYIAGTGGLLRAEHADLDLDGDPDLVTADWEDDTMTVFLNDGAGGFTLGYQTPISAEPRFLELADLNGDGDADVLVAGQSSKEIAVVYNVFGTQPIVVAAGENKTGVNFGSRLLP